MKQRFERPLSATERIWLGFDGAFSPYANQAVLEGRGNLDFEHLKSAVETASTANPGSRLVLSGSLRGSFWRDSGVTPRVRKVSAELWDGYGPENAPFLKDRLRHSGPTCEVVYAEGDVPRIIFRSNHGVMDGVGTLTWMEDIFRVLRGEPPIGTSSTLTEYQLVKIVSDKTMKMHPIDNIAPTGKDAKMKGGVIWKRLTFFGSYSRLMGRIAMALAQSAWKYGDGPFRMGIPVDIRQRQKGLRSTGNLSMAIYVEIFRDSTPESITAEIKRQLDEKYDCICIEGGDYIDLIPLWLMALSIKLIIIIPLLTGRHNVSAAISNLGQIDTAKYCGGGFTTDTIFFIPPRFDGLPAFVVLTGKTDRLEMTVSVPNSLAGGGRFERLLDDIGTALK
ncbi:MAG: hypothetical protein A2176_00430 [Spirochaetes bacterium RBG_13_51_14]|nr:MAG: hypothetical protein A2176_00430 [Spirochaetes bacterium RBG_13_51_14]